MKLAMHENSLFAILLRSRWWMSFVVGFGLFAVVRLVIPDTYAVMVPLPFVVIGCIAAWRQLRRELGNLCLGPAFEAPA